MYICYITLHSCVYSMTKYLIETLTKNASDVCYAQTTNSIYFIIEGIKVRVSDHHTVSTDYDLAVYSVNNSYLCIPNNCPFKQLIPCTKVSQILNVVKQVAFAKRLYTPATEACFIAEATNNVKRLRKLGVHMKQGSKFEAKVSSLNTEWVDIIEEYWKQSSESDTTKTSRVSSYISSAQNTVEFKQHLFKTIK